MPYIKRNARNYRLLIEEAFRRQKNTSRNINSTHQGDLMRKYLIYGVIILIALFILNWFKIINIPLLDIPDFTKSKQEMISSSQDSLKQLE